MMMLIEVFCEGLGLSCDDLDFVWKETQHCNLLYYTYASILNGRFGSVALSCKYNKLLHILWYIYYYTQVYKTTVLERNYYTNNVPEMIHKFLATFNTAHWVLLIYRYICIGT